MYLLITAKKNSLINLLSTGLSESLPFANHISFYYQQLKKKRSYFGTLIC